MRRAKYRLLFDWPAFEESLRATAAQRGWTESQVSAALDRDRLCSIEVDDLEAHLDWHEQLGFTPLGFGPSQG
jgi:hypothetical protein